MSLEWAQSYEAPTSLDETRVIGTRPRRSALWTLAGVFVSIPVVIVWLMLSVVITPGAIAPHLLLVPMMFWILFCYVMATNWGYRPAEYWFRAWRRYRALPKNLEGGLIVKHHTTLSDIPRAVIEIDQTVNLRMTAAANKGSTIKKLGVFFNSLKFPIQIVVKAWQSPDGQIERAWYIAVTADNEKTLNDQIANLIDGLKQAKLKSHSLNGDLYDKLQLCWTTAPRNGHIGPHKLTISRKNVIVDGEHVRGFVVKKMPRITDPNWLEGVLDGDLAVDCSIWIDPTDNERELDYLSNRVLEWETAQVLNFNRAGIRDPDIDDCIKDAARTRILLRRRELRVFLTTIAFVVRGHDQAQLEEREQLLAQRLRAQVNDDALIPLDFEHDLAPLLVVPIGEPAIEYTLRAVTPQLARAHPFSNSSLSMEGGVECGTSTGSKRTNKLNLFTLQNPHMVIFGNTGAGKTYWIKVFLYRLLRSYFGWEYLPYPKAPRVLVRVIQSEKDEYSGLAMALGSSGIPSAARGKVTRIKTESDLNKIFYGLDTESGRLNSFDIEVYDLTKMPQEQKGTAIAYILRAIDYDASLHQGSHSVVVIDELGIVIDSPEAASAIDTAYRRFRSIPNKDDSDPDKVNRVAVIGATQRPSDLLNHPKGKVLPDLAMTHVYFRIKPTELITVRAKLDLSEDEGEHLDSAEEGTGLLVADLTRVGFHLNETVEEHRFARS